MPKLYLDDLFAVVGGITFWGFAKEMAAFRMIRNSYAVSRPTGHPLASFKWEAGQQSRRVLDVLELSLIFGGADPAACFDGPVSLGPFFVISKVRRDFERAGMPQPLEAVA